MADTLDPRSSFIKAAAQSLGIDPGIIGAHVQLEVGSNSKTAGQFNFGNIKAGKSWAGKVANVDALEYDTRGNAVTEPSTFRSYTSPEEAGADYAALLKRRYPGAVGAKTAGDFASALKTGGYATDPQYVQKFVKVAGGYLPAAPTEGSLVPRPTYQRLADPLQEVMPERMQAGPGAGTGKKPVDLTMQSEVPARPVDRVAEAGAAEKVGLAQAAKENVPFLEMSQRALMTGFEGSLIRLKVSRDILGDNPVDPQYKVDPKLLRGLTEAEQDHMLGAVSQRDEDRRKFNILDNRESQEIQSARGQGWAMAAGVVAGLPLGAVTGLGAARAMSLFRAGSAQLMAQGRTGAAFASSIVENVGVDAGLAALQYKIDPFFTASDAITQVSLGALLSSAVAAPSLLREGRASARLTTLQDAQSAQRIQDTQAVEARLGPDADPAILTQQVQRLEEERAVQTVDAMRSKPPEPMLGEDMRPDFETLPQGKLAAVGKGEGSFDPSLNADRTLSSGYIVKEQPMGGGLDEWAVPGNWDTRRAVFSAGGAYETKIKERTGGFVSSLAELEALPPGVHAVAGTPPHFLQAMRAVRQVATKFIGDDFRIVMGTPITDPRVRGAVTNPTENTAIIQLNNSLDEVQAIRTAIHEVGHMIWHKQLSKMPEGTLQAVDTAYQRMMRAWSGQVGGGQVARDRRFSILSPERKVEGGMRPGEYAFSRDEHAAEQFVKYIEDDIRAQGVAVDRAVSSALRAAIDKVIEFIASAGRRLIGVEDEFKAFFDEVKAQVAASRAAPARAEAPAPRPKLGPRRSQSLDSPLDEKESIALDPDMQRLGLTIAPMETPQQRAEVVAMKDLHVKAEKADIQVDETRLSKLLDTALFQGGQSTANVLLRSKNAVARHFSAMMVENPSGAAGRRPNAAIAKHLHEQAFIGNTINDVQRHYSGFRREAGGNLAEDVFGGKNWEDFNKKIARELEARGRGTAVTSHPAVVKAADSLELAYERMRVAQVNTQTVGSANLPATSKGYMPHRLSNERIRNATNQQLAILHSAMTDQFIMKLDFDPTFSDMLASKYIDRVKNRALGGADSPVGAGHIGSSELVEEALEAAGMTRDQIRATMKKLVTAGPGHTKTRLKLDLNAEHALPDGGTFRLGDLFEDDQFTLLHSQAARVSGEVALTEFGVFGKAGLDVIRRAMQFGEHGAATRAEFDAFDQIAAELLGTPYGTQSKLVDRVLQANAVVRLGGIVWNQGAETINAMWHVGAGRTLDSIIGIPRLLGEVRALARGEAVPNGILEGLEKVYGGAEFGTLSYKTVFPFDNRSMDPHSYGEETITFMDRLLRGASHMQAKLSFWRAVHSAQQRGMAEQIVRKAAVFLKEGRTADIFLKDMGLSDDLIQRMSAELPRIATWDASGRLLELDVTKATDLDAAREFAQVVHRGVSQIIQGTFIGERSKWATDSHMRLLTQFRTFGLTAIEKQYGRQVGNVGEVKALGILLGSMCMSLPIYAARMQVQAMGREDHEEFLERAFQPERVARQSLNYVAGSGLSGDLLDALGALSGADLGGGRTGKEQDFVGNLVLPAAGLFNDAYKGLQNTQEGTDPEKLMKSLPLSNLPYLAPLIRALGED